MSRLEREDRKEAAAATNGKCSRLVNRKTNGHK